MYRIYVWCTNYEWQQGQYSVASDVKISVVNQQRRISRNYAISAVRNDWLPIGRYACKKGQEIFVELQSAKVPGMVVADAVLLVPE